MTLGTPCQVRRRMLLRTCAGELPAPVMASLGDVGPLLQGPADGYGRALSNYLICNLSRCSSAIVVPLAVGRAVLNPPRFHRRLLLAAGREHPW
jgi:hypothetical protein